MIEDLMGSLQKAQNGMQNAQKKLDNIIIKADAENGLVTVEANANKKIINIKISNELFEQNDKEAVEDLVLTAVNRALEKAEKAYEKEMSGFTQGLFGNIPGL